MFPHDSELAFLPVFIFPESQTRENLLYRDILPFLTQPCHFVGYTEPTLDVVQGFSIFHSGDEKRMA